MDINLTAAEIRLAKLLDATETNVQVAGDYFKLVISEKNKKIEELQQQINALQEQLVKQT